MKTTTFKVECTTEEEKARLMSLIENLSHFFSVKGTGDMSFEASYTGSSGNPVSKAEVEITSSEKVLSYEKF